MCGILLADSFENAPEGDVAGGHFGVFGEERVELLDKALVAAGEDFFVVTAVGAAGAVEDALFLVDQLAEFASGQRFVGLQIGGGEKAEKKDDEKGFDHGIGAEAEARLEPALEFRCGILTGRTVPVLANSSFCVTMQSITR